MYVMGGGRVAPNPSTEVDIYNPGSNTWSVGLPFTNARRNFPTDTNGTDHIWLSGGYEPATPAADMEIFAGACPSPTPTATGSPSPSPTCTPSAFRVLIAYADTGGPPTTIQSAILAEPGVTACDLFDAASGTPTLAQLEQYNIVFAFSNNGWSDATGMGNVLADYQDSGTGTVVVGTFAYDNRGPWLLAGRWVTGGYTPFNSTANTNFSSNTATITSNCLTQGVNTLTAFYRNGVTLTSGAVAVATWTDGPPAVAYQTNNGHTGVGINAYLGQNPMDFAGDWGHLIVNAGRCYGAPPCGTPSPTPTATATATATATSTGTPSPSPSCTAGGTPGPWTQAAPVAIDHYGGFMDSDGTVAYEGGGYSFSTGDNINEFGKFNPVANTWTPLAPVPDLNNALASGVYAPNVNKLFVFGGEELTTATVVNTTRIYDVASNTWSTRVRTCLMCERSWPRATIVGTGRSIWWVVIPLETSARRSCRRGSTTRSPTPSSRRPPYRRRTASAVRALVWSTVICMWRADAMPPTP